MGQPLEPLIVCIIQVQERMEHLGLRNDSNAISIALNIVRERIREKHGDITIDVLESQLKTRDLYAPESDEQCVTICMNTIGDRVFDLVPDYTLDWRRYFEGRPDAKGHQLQNSDNWNKKLLPELRKLHAEIQSSRACKLVRVRGLSRLSAWLAFGFTFSEVAGHVIEVEQQSERWRTDVAPSADFDIVISSHGGQLKGEALTGTGTTVACGISVAGSLDEDVRLYLSKEGSDPVAALLLLRPNRELGRDALRSPSDAVALVRKIKNLIREFVKHRGATRLLLFYFGPLSGAYFLGHQLNAICRDIQIMEDQQPGYAPSFTLC